MILLRLFVLVLVVFVVLVLGLGMVLLLKIRTHLQNPFLRREGESRMAQDGDVIEGEYEVIGSDDTKTG